jgi:hypothetical protein
LENAIMMKSILAVSIFALFVLSAHASQGNIGRDSEKEGDTYATEHQELDNDLQNNLQMNVTRDADGRVEVKDKNGDIYSYRPNAGTTTGVGCASSQQVCYESAPEGNGAMVAHYSNGKTETFVGESHNENQLKSDAGALGLTLVSKINGVATFRSTAGSVEYRVRYSPLLRLGAANVNPGIRVENDGRIIERYADGLEQEILPIK